MKLSEFYNEVSRLTDTAKTQINVAETKRVLACAFDVLVSLDSDDMADTVAKGLAAAKKRQK